jgi:hypothetical protein
MTSCLLVEGMDEQSQSQVDKRQVDSSGAPSHQSGSLTSVRLMVLHLHEHQV